MIKIIEPKNKIAEASIKYWRLLDIILTVFLFLIAAIFNYIIKYYNIFNSSYWSDKIIWGVYIFILFYFLLNFFYIPIYKKKTWRYHIDSNYVILKHGGIFRTNYKVIPMDNIQYVHISSNIISQKFNLSNVDIFTVASMHSIPSLPNDEAENVKLIISQKRRYKNEL